MFRSKPLGLGTSLPPRKSKTGTGPSTQNTSHGTYDVNAPKRAVSVVTDSHVVGNQQNIPTAAINSGNQQNQNPLALRRNLNHAAASGVTGGLPIESEIITIGSPHFDEGIGAASAEPLVEIEETSMQRTNATKQQTSPRLRRQKRKNDLEKDELPNISDPANKERPIRTTKRSRKDDGDDDQEKEKKTTTTTTTATKTTNKSPNKSPNKRNKISELIGQVVHVPGSVFFVEQPEFYIGDIKRRDPHHRSAVEVVFRDDNSTYWFPMKDVVRWLDAQRQRDQVEIIIEEEEEERKVAGVVAGGGVGIGGAGIGGVAVGALQVDSAKDLNDLNRGIARKNSMHDEELAAQALTDISAGGAGLSMTKSGAGGGGAGGGGDGIDSPSGVKAGGASKGGRAVFKRKQGPQLLPPIE